MFGLAQGRALSTGWQVNVVESHFKKGSHCPLIAGSQLSPVWRGALQVLVVSSQTA